MDLPDILLAAGGGWLAAQPFIAVPIGRMIRGRDRQQSEPIAPASYPPPVPRPLHRIYRLPPVPLPAPPRITQEQVDETWASVWPSYVEPADIDTLEQRVFDRLFDELVAIEGLEP